jgi:OOP family OmpA-OmpF porin
MASRLAALAALASCAAPPAPAVVEIPAPLSAAPSADPEPPPPARPVAKPFVLVLQAQSLFRTGTDAYGPGIETELQPVLAHLEEHPEVTRLRIEGHTDNAGMLSANQELSEKRALAAARWLVAHGVDCRRLIPVGFGPTRPRGDNTTTPGRQRRDRRLVFVDTAVRGKPLGGMPVDGGGRVAGDPCR